MQPCNAPSDPQDQEKGLQLKMQRDSNNDFVRKGGHAHDCQEIVTLVTKLGSFPSSEKSQATMQSAEEISPQFRPVGAHHLTRMNATRLAIQGKLRLYFLPLKRICNRFKARLRLS